MNKGKGYLKTSGNTIELLRFMYWKNTVWKKDAYLYLRMMRTNPDTSRITREYKKLLELGLIKEYTPFNYQDLKKPKTEVNFHKEYNGPYNAYTCISITDKGYKYLYDNDKLKSYKNEIYKEYKTIVQEPFNTNVHANYYKGLLQSHIKTIVESAGIANGYNHKPSLLNLLACISRNREFYSEIEPSEFMKKHYMHFNYDKCIRLVKDIVCKNNDGSEYISYANGIYYTLEEFRDFINCLKPNDADTFKGSVCKGILLSSKGIYMVYLSEPGNNKMIGYTSIIESKIINHLKEHFVDALNVPKYDPYDTDKDIYVGAVVFCDTPSLVPAMVMSRKYGRDKSTKHSNFDISARVLCGRNSHQNLFSRIFVIPSTIDGVASLRYLIQHDINEYYHDGMNLVLANKEFFDYEPDKFYPHVGELSRDIGNLEVGQKVIYLPVFEARLLRSLSCDGSTDKFAIICSEEKIDAVAHSIRKDFQVYDEDGNKVYFDPDVNKYVYMKPHTFDVLEKIVAANELCDKGRSYTSTQLEVYSSSKDRNNIMAIVTKADELDQLRGTTPEIKHLPIELPTYDEFGFRTDGYNKYASQSKPKGEHKKRTRRKKRIQTKISIDSEEKLALVKKAASISNKSYSRYCWDILCEQSKQLVEEYEKQKTESELKSRMANKLI